MFDSVMNALQYLKQNISTLWNAQSILSNRLVTIQAAMKKAQTANDQPALGKLIVLKGQTEQLMKERADLASKLNPFSTWFSSNSLGVFPVWMVAGAVGLATTLYAFLEKLKNEGKALELVQAGILKPEQAKAILTGGGISESFGNISNLLMWAAIGYALVVFGPSLLKGKA